MEFTRPEYWNGQPFPSPGDLPNPGIEPRSLALWADSLPSEPQGAQYISEVNPQITCPQSNYYVLILIIQNIYAKCMSGLSSIMNSYIVGSTLLKGRLEYLQGLGVMFLTWVGYFTSPNLIFLTLK